MMPKFELQPMMHVAGTVDDAFPAGMQSSPVNPDRSLEEELARLRAELAKAKREAQALVDRNRFDFELFAESAAPRFVFSDAFFIDYQKKEVNMNTKWFLDRKFSQEQLLWATYHELAHFYDFAEDHRAVLRKFDDIRRQSIGTGDQLAEKFCAAIPAGREDAFAAFFERQPIDRKHPERGTMNRFEAMAYKAHHEFWNIVDDIYVNSLVAKRKPVYGTGGRAHGEVERLYREQLFADADFSMLPRHKQYIYALIRQAMLPEEAVVVSDEIREVLDRKLRIGGKEKTAAEVVRDHVRSPGSTGIKAGVRYIAIEATLEPVFLELLQKDIEEWKPQMPEQAEPQAGEGGEPKDKDGAGSNQDGDQTEGNENGGESGEGQSSESDGGGEERQGEGESDEAENKDGAASDSEGDQSQGGVGDEKPSGQDAGSGNGETPDDVTPNQEGGEGSSASSGKSMQDNIDDAFNPTKKKGMGQGGDGSDNNSSSPSMPNPIQSPEDLKDIVDIVNEGRREWREVKRKEEEEEKRGERSEADITAENDAARKKQFAQTWAQEFEMTSEAFERSEAEYEAIEREIEPYLAALDRLWQRIIYGRSRELRRESASRFKTGIDIDIDEIVRQFPEIASGSLDAVRVMRRTEAVRGMVERPELIRVRLVGDASESMGYDDGTKRRVLKQMFVLLSTSLRRFETLLNLTRGKTKSKLSVDTETWLFGGAAYKAKPFRGKQGRYERERAATIAAFAGLGEDRGSTRDDLALSEIDDSLSDDDVRKIRTKKILELVFELTDGGTDSDGRANAKRAIESLDAKGVIARAFQIGVTGKDEQNIFQDIWNADAHSEALPPDRQRGFVVGTEVGNLIPAMTAALLRLLGRVEL